MGAGYNDAGYATFKASSDITQWAAVKVGGTGYGTVDHASGSNTVIGVAARGGVSGAQINVALKSKMGSFLCIAGEAITVGDQVYLGTNGVVGKTNTNTLIGVALQDAATGAAFEVMPL